MDTGVTKCRQMLLSSPALSFLIASFSYLRLRDFTSLRTAVGWKGALPDATSCLVCALFTLARLSVSARLHL